jgi:hypothetical protein
MTGGHSWPDLLAVRIHQTQFVLSFLVFRTSKSPPPQHTPTAGLLIPSDRFF